MRGETKTWYEKACTLAGRYFPWLKGRVSDEFYEYVDFTGLSTNGEDAYALAVGSALFSLALLVAATLTAFLLHLPWILFLFSSALVPLIIFNYLGNYPKIYADTYKVKTLGAAPELISNLAMSLKIVPNLEKAVEFAASKTRGQMGLEFKKMAWDTYMRVHRNSEDALTKFSEKWIKWDANLASSVYFLKGALLERSEEGRLRTIDRSVDIILKGTLYKIEEFARYLTLPTTVLYFVGLILPLIMIAVLPTLLYLGVGVGASHLFFVYNIMLPFFVYIWSRSILSKRPITTLPPEIPEDIEVQKNYRATGGVSYILSAAFLLGIFLFIFGLIALIYLKTPLTFFGFDLTIFIIWGLAITAFTYLIRNNLHKSIIRSEIKEMEREFVDALMQLGNRISEGRPIEDAFLYVGRVMKGSKIGEVLANSASLMAFSRKTLHSALFEKDEGSLKCVYSPMIRSVTEMIVEAAKKGNRVAGVAVNRTVEHLIKIREIDDIIERRLDDVASSMRSTLLFFGPFVGGVVVSIQNLMNSQLAKSKGAHFFTNSYSTFPRASEFGFIEIFETANAEALSLGVLQLIIGIYLIEEAIIFSNFISELKVGDDRIFKSMEAGKNILTATAIFTMAIFITSIFF